jgi:hypothetical protein
MMTSRRGSGCCATRSRAALVARAALHAGSLLAAAARVRRLRVLRATVAFAQTKRIVTAD